MDDRLKLLEGQLAYEKAQNRRLRMLRDRYRTKVGDQKKEITSLKELLAQLTQRTSRNDLPNDVYDSDDELYRSQNLISNQNLPSMPIPSMPTTSMPNEPTKQQKASATGTGPFANLNCANDVSSGPAPNKVQEIDKFDGNFRKWPEWRTQLKRHLATNARRLDNEDKKITCVRMYCTSVALDLINGKTDPMTPAIERYKYVNDVLSDLEFVFGASGNTRATDCARHLYGTNLPMKAKEKFTTFLARFTTITAPLLLPEEHKISHLRRCIPPSVPYDVLYGQLFPTYRSLIDRLLQWDLDGRPTLFDFCKHPSPSGFSFPSTPRFDFPPTTGSPFPSQLGFNPFLRTVTAIDNA
ncbi:MAG: hypothetical protein MMC33_009036 [Icmadophila ericetorum]|nr:hypothetical protein [Icmadophila ericetorum]